MSEIFIERIKRIDHFIARKATGTPEEFARKMRLSIRCVFKYISIMRKNGAPICYSRKTKTYFYSRDGSLRIGFYEDAVILTSHI